MNSKKARSSNKYDFSDSSEDEIEHKKVQASKRVTGKRSPKPKKDMIFENSNGREQANDTNFKTSVRSIRSTKPTSSMDLKKDSADGASFRKQSQHNPNKSPEDHQLYHSGLHQLLEDDHSLKVKMNSLQYAIRSQEKTLKSMHRKIVSEKSDLASIQNMLDHKSKKESANPQRKPDLSRSYLTLENDERQTKMSNRPPRSKSKDYKKPEEKNVSAKQNILDLNDEDNNERQELSKQKSRTKSSNKFSRKKTNDIIEQELEKKAEESLFQRRRINGLKSHMNELARKSELEIERLRKDIHHLNEENFKLKCRGVSQKDYETVESLYAKKIRDLEQAVLQKDREMSEKEGYYKGHIEDIRSQMEELQREVRKMTEYEEQVQDLTEHLHLKDKELQMTKKYYMEKFQAKIDDQAKQKKEWSKTYNDMLSEIRNLKGEVDLLSYENKRLNSNTSDSLRSRDAMDSVFSRKFQNRSIHG